MPATTTAKVGLWSRHMRVILVIIFLVALAAVQLPGPAAAASPSCDASSCSAAVTRAISTNDWGTTFVNDTVSLTATSSVSSMILGIPSSLSTNLHQITASDSQGGIVQVLPLTLNQTGRYQPYQFAFPSPKAGSYSFNVKAVFSGLLAFDRGTSKYTFLFGAFPVVDGTLGEVRTNTTVLTRDWPSPTVAPGNANVTGGRLSLTVNPVAHFNATIWTMTFSSTGTSQNIFDVTAARTVNISQSGTVRVSDTYNLTNKGKDVPSIVLPLPAGTTSLTCSDLIGQLDQTNYPSNCPAPSVLAGGTASETFSPRFGTIKNNGAAIVTLQYTLSGGSYVSSDALGKYTLAFQMFNGVKFVSTSLQTKIVMPSGFRLGVLTTQTPLVSGNQILLQTSSVTPYSNLSFSMTYQLDPFWSALDPLAWSGLLEGAIVAIALVVASGSQGGLVGATPIQLISRFTELYDEKSSLRMEEDKLDEDSVRGAVNKHDYKRRKRVMDLRLSELDRLLAPIKQQLSTSQSRYLDMIRRIEKAEAELQVVKSSLADLKNQNRTGRISRELYDQLSVDLLRRKARAQQTIDNIVIGLREEAR